MTVAEYRSGSDLNTGYSYFQNGDVLVAKITPCYENNKTAQVEIDREHGFGSTEFHVIRPDGNKLDSAYLTYFLRQDSVRETGARRMTGSAGQRRVPRSFLEQLEIPLPPLDEQRRIAAILDQADALRRKRREAIARSSLVPGAIFRETIAGNDSFENHRLDELCEIITDGTHHTPKYVDEGILFLSARNVTSGRIDWENVKYIPEYLHVELQNRVSPRKGDVLLAKNGTTGVAALVDRDCVFDIYVSLAMLRAKHDVLPEYLCMALNSESCRRQFDHSLRGIGVSNLHLVDIRRAKVPKPPLDVQWAFVEKVRAWNAIEASLVGGAAALDALVASLQQRAFNGELTAKVAERALAEVA